MISKKTTLAVLACAVVSASALALEDGQRAPKRQYAIGDSITRAFDARMPGDNQSLSWSAGYHGWWQWMTFTPDIRSHNQRIDANFGDSGRSNTLAAITGSQVDSILDQAQGMDGAAVDYVTLLSGANDVCVSSPAELIPVDEFKNRYYRGLSAIANKINDGGTVAVAAIPDIHGFYQVGLQATALGIVSCPSLWNNIIYPICEAMTDNDLSEAERAYVADMNYRYNQAIGEVVDQVKAEMAANGKTVFIDYTRVLEERIDEMRVADLSTLDCFHPSADGQAKIAQYTWNDGPFAAYSN
ncbi:SGNH/GDSL hydrolase family protein [Gallaecimonas sp. GXIMD4217]|uniref:SGNH/GDSL hydrolase family protein n=1 Tax=Gallaecimonas sp. GXIMD4217 TaxID=3131927 RepID=UPI00311AC2AA